MEIAVLRWLDKSASGWQIVQAPQSGPEYRAQQPPDALVAVQRYDNGQLVMTFLLALFSAITLMPSGDTAWKQPQLATEGNTVVVAFGEGNAVMAAISRDGGASFSKPARVGEAGVISLGRHRGPRVAISGKSIVIAAIAGEKGRGQDGELVAWRSVDMGATWSGPTPVSDVAGAAREGLHTLSAGGKGELVAAWLDLREKGTKLVGSISRDGGASWSKNFLIYSSPDGHICECCHPSSVVGKDGSIHVMFRNWTDGSRDMWLASSADGGKSFTARKLGEGTWKLNACPMDGGGVVLGKDGKPATTWRREGQIFLTNGEKFLAPGWNGKDPAIAMGSDGKPVVVWTEAMKVLFSEGGEPRVLAEHGSTPAIAGGKQVIAAWESGNGISVLRIR